jgi:hypothetical protein
MLNPAHVTRQIIESTLALGKARRAAADYQAHPGLHQVLRSQIDVLTLLLDESEKATHWKIKSMIYEFEALD